MSRVTSSHVLTPITSTIPIWVNRATPNCVFSRFRWNLDGGCSTYNIITSWPDLTWPFFNHKFRKRCPMSYKKISARYSKRMASGPENLKGVASTPPLARVNTRTAGVLSKLCTAVGHICAPPGELENYTMHRQAKKKHSIGLNKL